MLQKNDKILIFPDDTSKKITDWKLGKIYTIGKVYGFIDEDNIEYGIKYHRSYIVEKHEVIKLTECLEKIVSKFNT